MIGREPREFDGIIMGNLRQGTTFFASTALIAAVGLTWLVLLRREFAS